jgi:HK97 family phage prohead protease
VANAFKQAVTDRNNQVVVLYQHSARDPIGKATVNQDRRGLHVRGTLALRDATAAKAHALMESGVLDAMSIGYEILPGGAEYAEGVRILTALKLHEVSVVTFGMNELARVDAVKTVSECKQPRELEHLLRDNPHFALSSRKAKAAANALWPILNEREAQGDARDERADVVAIAKTLDQISQLLKGYSK